MAPPSPSSTVCRRRRRCQPPSTSFSTSGHRRQNDAINNKFDYEQRNENEEIELFIKLLREI